MKTQTVLKWVVGVAVVGFALWLGVTFPRSNPVINQIVGGASGPVNYDHNFFLAGLTSGGYVATSSTASTYTTSEKDFAQTPSVISWLVNVPTTVTITATSTFPYVPNVGDVASVLIYNATSTTGALTFDAGSGLTLKKSEDDNAIAIAHTAWGRLTFIRTAALTVTAILENTVEH